MPGDKHSAAVEAFKGDHDVCEAAKFVRELLSENTHRARARPKCRQRNSLALL